MKKYFLLPMLLAASVTAFAANPFKQSYGTWIDDEGEKHVITQAGATWVNPKMMKTEYRTVSGRKLLKEIRESIKWAVEADDENNGSGKQYKDSLRPALKLIDPGKNYPYMISYCYRACDGAQGYYFINEQVGLKVMSAPDDYYSIILKK